MAGSVGRSAVDMQLWLLLLVAAARESETSSSWTCAAVQRRPTDSLQHCRFLRDAGTPVTDATPLQCDVLGRGRSHPEVLNYTIYFHARYVLRATPLQDLDVDSAAAPTLHLCMGYVDVVYEKLLLDHEWTNVTFGIYTNDGFLMLSAMQNLRCEMTFDGQVPVAYLVLDRDCWQQLDTRDESCLLDVRILQEVKSLNVSVSPMDPVAFTTMLREMFVDTLHGQGEAMYVDINPDISMLTQTYVTLMLRGFGYRHLHLGGGHWDVLENILPPQARLKTVQLPNNRFKRIAKGNFANVMNLELLDLSNNSLTNLPDDLGVLKKLRSLDLSWNEFLLHDVDSVVSIGLSLKDLKSLKSLSLSGVSMKQLDVLGPILALGNVTLLRLSVSDCGLESLPSFRRQAELLELDLSGNRLQDVAGADLHLLVNLKTLNLARNRISGPLRLDLGVARLQLLDLSANTIKDPSAVVVSKPVTSVDLSRNQVSNWTAADALAGFHAVNLSLNVISGASAEMCRSLSGPRAVDLGGNVFNCEDCRMPALQRWLRDGRTTTRVLNMGSDAPLACALPEAGVPITDFPFDERPCLEAPPDLWLVVGVPVAGVGVVALLVAALFYRYRFEVKYFIKRSLWRRGYNDRGDVYSYDAFVSYSRSDRWWVVDKLCPNMELSADRYRFCMHERDFALRSLIFDNIQESMKSSRFMIVVLSNNFLESQWCRWELDMANQQVFSDDDDLLILVQLEPLNKAKIPKRLRLLMDTQTTIPWPRGGDASLSVENQVWCRLRQAIGNSLYSYREDRTLMMALQP